MQYPLKSQVSIFTLTLVRVSGLNIYWNLKFDKICNLKDIQE